MSQSVITVQPVTIIKVHDGDTFTALIPIRGIWPDMKDVECVVRVAHVNAAELKTPLGAGARDAVIAWLGDGTRFPFKLHCWGRENYGRLLADIEDASGELLSDYVLTLPGTIKMSVHEMLLTPTEA